MAPPLVLQVRRRRAPEPASRLPLRWGDHRDRALIGAALIAGGAALVAQTTAYTLALGLVGTALHVAGWLVQPARPRARVVAALVGAAACWCAIGGAPAMWPLALLLPCWLAVRRRPPATALLTALPFAVALVTASALPWVADKPIVFGATGAAIVAGAAVARELALRVRVRLVLGRSIASGAPASASAPVD